MEKIVNMQVQAGATASSAITRQVQNSVQDTKDDFIKLLQQQKESARQPEEAKDARKTKDAKNAKKPDEKQTEEPAEEQVEEMDLDEELTALTQMELQQSILQQSVVQIAEPVVEMETESAPLVVSDVSVTEKVQESGELPLEVSALPEQPKAEAVRAEVKTDAVKAEVKTEAVKAEAKTDLVKAEVHEQVAELPKEEHQEASVTDQRSQDTQTMASGKQDTVQERKDEFRKELTGQDVNQTAPMQTASAPAQVERPQNVMQTGFRAGENTVRSTVEELPQEFGRAVTAGKLGDGHVLTVELEPASLGKLTVRLEYEAGRTMVSVMASNPKTLELLGEKASEIAAILKEHTGEETVIYTEQPQREPGEEAQEQSGHGRQSEERQQRREEERPQGDSFIQQLRLGLV